MEILLIDFSSIVLLGNFNPSIFHPEWFDRFKIVPIQEVQWAESKKPDRKELPFKGGKLIISEVPPLLVKPDFAELHFRSFRINVTPSKFECSTFIREKFSLMKEVTVKIFSLLMHTPIKALGINFTGDRKPKKVTGEILKALFAKSNKKFIATLGENYDIGGILSSIQNGRKTTLRIEKSEKVDNGIYFNFNFHREIEPPQAEIALEALSQNYQKDLEESLAILNKLLEEK